jgi:hypothetical protein
MSIPIPIGMLIDIKQNNSIDHFGRNFKHDIITLKCDVCQKVWETRGSKTRIQSRKTHSCSLECKKNAHMNGGVIERQRAVTCSERYGAENPFASDACKKKIRQTLLRRFGVEHALQSKELYQKFQNTLMRNHNVMQSMASPQIREKQIKTMRQNWGVDYAMQLQHVKDALMSGSIAKFGVPFPMQNIEHQKKIFSQRDGMTWMSKPEKQFRILLEEKFGKENVKVQQLLEGKWSVDFYVLTIDTWVSFDGVYWHGLDRPLDEIKNSLKPRDIAIYKKWIKDRELDIYMTERNMRLVRITDSDFRSDPFACISRVGV